MNFKYWYYYFKKVSNARKQKVFIILALLFAGITFLNVSLLFPSGIVDETKRIVHILSASLFLPALFIYSYWCELDFKFSDQVKLLKHTKFGDKTIDYYIDTIINLMVSTHRDRLIIFEIDCIKLYLRLGDEDTLEIMSQTIIKSNELIIQKYNSIFSNHTDISQPEYRKRRKPKAEWEIENAFHEIEQIIDDEIKTNSLIIYPNSDVYKYFKEYLVKLAEYNPVKRQVLFERMVLELGG